MTSLIEKLRDWLSRPTLERAEQEQIEKLTPAERENAELDYESKKDDEALLHRSVAEDVLHFDDDSKPPRH